MHAEVASHAEGNVLGNLSFKQLKQLCFCTELSQTTQLQSSSHCNSDALLATERLLQIHKLMN
jgi:hypothetical protein